MYELIARRRLLGAAAGGFAGALAPGAAAAVTNPSGHSPLARARAASLPERAAVRKRVPVALVRDRWTSDREYFIAPRPLGDDNNSGTNPGQPWATPIYAHGNFLWNHDFAGYDCFVRFAPGTYTGDQGQLKAWGMPLGTQDEGNYQWTGVFGDPSAVKLMGYGFHSYDGCMMWLKDVEITTTEVACLGAFLGMLEFFRVRFGNVPGRYHMISDVLGFIMTMDGYSIVGNANRHANVTNGGYIGIKNQVTISPNLSLGYFALAQNGVIDMYGARFAGNSFKGIRYKCMEGGTVRTGTNNPLFIPGSAAGSTTGPGGVVTGFYS